MTSEELKYKVGDRVWVVLDRKGLPEYIPVSKSGRKWITLDNVRSWRFLIGSQVLEEPGYGRIGTVFESQEKWEAIVTERNAKNALFKKFDLISSSPIRKLSLEQLEAIDRILEGQNA